MRFIGEVPASIWQFTGASPFARPQAANQYNRTVLDAQQRATLTQRDVHGGLFGGFGWERGGVMCPRVEPLRWRVALTAGWSTLVIVNGDARYQVASVNIALIHAPFPDGS